jgi:MFS family permease
MFFFGSLFPTFFLDRFGRRRPMMIGCALCGISMMMIAALLSPQGQGDEALAKRASSASVAFFFTVGFLSRTCSSLLTSKYMLCFGATMNCIPWVYVPEILPLQVRAKGTAIAISSNWVCILFNKT